MLMSILDAIDSHSICGGWLKIVLSGLTCGIFWLPSYSQIFKNLASTGEKMRRTGLDESVHDFSFHLSCYVFRGELCFIFLFQD